MLAKPGWLYNTGDELSRDNLNELQDNLFDLTKSSIVTTAYQEGMIMMPTTTLTGF
jgi:hypothetical protein